MSKEKMAELLSDDRSGGEVTPPGLSLSRILSEVGEELSHLGKQGSHELAAALFTGSAFVMYPHAGEQSVEQEPQHGLPIEAQKVEPMSIEPMQKESDGREM